MHVVRVGIEDARVVCEGALVVSEHDEAEGAVVVVALAHRGKLLELAHGVLEAACLAQTLSGLGVVPDALKNGGGLVELLVVLEELRVDRLERGVVAGLEAANDANSVGKAPESAAVQGELLRDFHGLGLELQGLDQVVGGLGDAVQLLVDNRSVEEVFARRVLADDRVVVLERELELLVLRIAVGPELRAAQPVLVGLRQLVRLGRVDDGLDELALGLERKRLLVVRPRIVRVQREELVRAALGLPGRPEVHVGLRQHFQDLVVHCLSA